MDQNQFQQSLEKLRFKRLRFYSQQVTNHLLHLILKRIMLSNKRVNLLDTTKATRLHRVLAFIKIIEMMMLLSPWEFSRMTRDIKSLQMLTSQLMKTKILEKQMQHKQKTTSTSRISNLILKISSILIISMFHCANSQPESAHQQLRWTLKIISSFPSVGLNVLDLRERTLSDQKTYAKWWTTMPTHIFKRIIKMRIITVPFSMTVLYDRWYYWCDSRFIRK